MKSSHFQRGRHMSIRLLTALGFALLASTASAQVPAADPIQFVARCTFERDGGDALRMLCGFGTQKDAEALFTKHAQAHGWRWDIEGPDFSDFGRPAACPVWLLDQLAGVGGVPCSSGSVFVDRAIAGVLARNGRADEALCFLSSAIEDVKLGFRPQLSDADDFLQVWGPHIAEFEASYLSRWAATSAARAGEWGRALEFAQDWTPLPPLDGERFTREPSALQLFQARCLVALGRCDEAVAIAREAAYDCGWRRYQPQLIALWIECAVSSHRARDSNSALEEILFEFPEQAHEACHNGLRAWQIAHMSREEQLANLEELAEFDSDKALSLLLSSGSLAIVAHLDALELVGGRLCEPALAEVLAETGHPDVGPALQAASDHASAFYRDRFLLRCEFDGGLDRELIVWELANERWNALAVVR